MATRTRKAVELPAQALLREPVPSAREKLADRIEKGRQLLATQINNPADLDAAKKVFRIWDDYNTELITHMFTTAKYADEYSIWAGIVAVSYNYDFSADIREHFDDIATRIARLESLSQRLELIPLAPSALPTEPGAFNLRNEPKAQQDRSRVFIVHGHNEAVQQSVARCIERLGFEAVILNEQANGGQTIIEKLEANANVGFAVVLLTGDDVGRAARDVELRTRARQNVVLELGYFLAKLGRSNVCALHEAGVEIPSDIMGVVYIPLDSGEGWKYRMAKELQAAGYAVDLNRL